MIWVMLIVGVTGVGGNDDDEVDGGTEGDNNKNELDNVNIGRLVLVVMMMMRWVVAPREIIIRMRWGNLKSGGMGLMLVMMVLMKMRY